MEKKATFGAGCFWGVEAAFRQLDGVTRTRVGYSGGTIGGYLSAQEMEVIDMGVPLLSMHAPFEMSSKVDVWSFYRFMGAFLGS